MTHALLLCFFGLFAVGCIQELPSSQTPIHPNPNMDDVARFEAQELNPFFPNQAAMRLPVAGTVARGQLGDDLNYFTGIQADGDTLQLMPMPITQQLLARGAERYNIYCAPCHGRTGGADGLKGIVVQRGLIAPPSYAEERLVRAGDGYIFWVISNGKGNMSGYKWTIPVADRWAIVAYVRALQRSQTAPITDVPADKRGSF